MYKYNRRTVSWLVFIIVLIFLTGCSNSNNKKGKTTIDSLEWRAVAEIEEWKVCNECGWEVPEGAEVYKEQEEIKSYKTVGYVTKHREEEYEELVGYVPYVWRPIYRTKTRIVPYKEAVKEPVYATKYYYTIYRWVHSKNIQLACGNEKDYNYPEYGCSENERVKSVQYKYFVNFKFDGWGCTHEVDKEKWESLQVGQEIPVEKKYGAIHILWD